VHTVHQLAKSDALAIENVFGDHILARVLGAPILVGVGEECISAEYDDCRRLVAQLSVYDERENSSPLDVSFMLRLYRPSRRRSEESCDDEEFVA
jgi:hypothetical protein